jgi:hypothetical protein
MKVHEKEGQLGELFRNELKEWHVLDKIELAVLAHHHLDESMILQLEAAPQCLHAVYAQIERVLAQECSLARTGWSGEYCDLSRAMTFQDCVQLRETTPLFYKK